MASLTERVTVLEAQVADLETRVTALEAGTPPPPSGSIVLVLDNSGAQVTDSSGNPVVL